jgi:Putative zinc-finger
MNCRRVTGLLSNHLEGHLGERVASAVAAHLEDCPACRGRRDAFLATEVDLRELPELPLPSGLHDRVIVHWTAALEAPASNWRRRRLALSPPAAARWAPLGATAVLAVVLGLTWWAHGKVSGHSGPQGAERPPRQRTTPSRAAFRAQANPTEPGVAHRLSVPTGPSNSIPPFQMQSRTGNGSQGGGGRPSSMPGPRFPTSVGDALADLNGEPGHSVERGSQAPADAWEAAEWQVRRGGPVRDDFVQIPFPRLADVAGQQIPAALESYEREAAIVDARLSREVTVQQKATALADLCDRLRSDTGIQLVAGPSVADEKVTTFCEKVPLREVMRQLSRPFGYTWLRSGKAGEYRYELVQDLRSQLLEEELRNRDRSAALLALDKETERYRPYLQLSPDEALSRAKTAPPNEKKLLENLATHWGWGPIHMYFRLSPQELATLRAEGALAFSTDPYPGQHQLPPDLAHGVLQSWREWHMVKTDRGFATKSVDDPTALPVSAFPELGAQIRLYLRQSELGQFTLSGSGGYLGPKKELDLVDNGPNGGVLAAGMSPVVLQPDNAVINAKLAGDPALRPRVAIQTRPSCSLSPSTGGEAGAPAPAPKATTADVLEALHRASGSPIVADYYTRLYKLEEVAVKNRLLFETLDLLADRMRLRWHKKGRWLEFRSSGYYYDRLKEVPNRLLRRWETARRQHGALTLDDLVEIGQLPDAQLDGAEMAEGARECWGLAEWDLVRKDCLRPHLRYLANFTPEQRQEALSSTGLAFPKMSLAQQQQFIANALYVHGEPLRSLDELAGAVLRVDYTKPGWFEWRAAALGPFRWMLPVEPGPQGRRVLRAPIRERTREAAWQAAGRAQSQVREALLRVARHYQLPIEETNSLLQKAEIEIVPTKLYLGIIYIPGSSNRRPLHLFDNDGHEGVYLGAG